MKLILEDFCNFTGLSINQQQKSFLTLSANVTDGQDLAMIAGLQLQNLPIQHLGVPVTGRTIRH